MELVTLCQLMKSNESNKALKICRKNALCTLSVIHFNLLYDSSKSKSNSIQQVQRDVHSGTEKFTMQIYKFDLSVEKFTFQTKNIN